jgi:hypothetical protein
MGGGGEPSRTTAKKLGLLEIIHSILSEHRLLMYVYVTTCTGGSHVVGSYADVQNTVVINKLFE